MVVCAWNSKNDYKTICGVLLTDVGLHLVCVPELLGCVRFKDYEELFVLFEDVEARCSVVLPLRLNIVQFVLDEGKMSR